MDSTSNTFAVEDYVVFAVVLTLSVIVGIFYAVKDARSKSSGTQEYLLAGRKMHYVPVALSLTVSFMSAITILGNPAEVYRYGMMIWWLVPAFFIAAVIISEFYIPLFYRLGITSSYEYLEKRFNRIVRISVTAAFIVETMLYAGIVIYAPSLALSQVTNINIVTAILSTGIVCTVYTTLGGLKGVIWADVLQIVIILVGLIAVIIRGSVITEGGFPEIWRTCVEGGRLTMNVVDTDPRVRHSVWSLLVGGAFLWLGLYAVSQSQVQRYLCCRSEREAKTALFLNAFGLLVVITLTCFTGLVIYGRYAECDPLTQQGIRPDRLLPLMVMEILREYRGLPGVFVACVYSGGLSTISTGINAMACVTVEDFLKPFTNFKSNTNGWISRGLAVVYGLICIGMAFMAARFEGVLQAAISIFGIVGGPLIGVYTMGFVFPFVNSWGALAGLISGLACTSWMFRGATDYRAQNISTSIRNALSVSTAGCPETASSNISMNSTDSIFITVSQTLTALPQNTTHLPPTTIPGIVDFYSVSYLYYGCIGCAVTLVMGIVVGLLTCGWRDRGNVQSELLRPPFDHKIFRTCLPERIRYILRFGVEWVEPPLFNSNPSD